MESVTAGRVFISNMSAGPCSNCFSRNRWAMITQKSQSRMREIFNACLQHDSPTHRCAVLDRECGGDAELRDSILQLLEAFDASQSFLEQPLGLACLQYRVEDPDPTALHLHALAQLPTVGNYKLLEQIGEGGMGVVYVAQQNQPIRRKVALKLIKPGMDSKQVIARFEAERQALAMMNHTHIAKVLDAGTTETGLPYFVMELVKGTPITEYCDAHKLDLRQRMQVFIKVCDAVEHAHQKGIIHRDLKPSNVLVELEDVRSVPKVIDFGVAKATQQPLVENAVYTGLSQMIGTPLYMSPEQAGYNSLDVDTRSDVYSLGIILYELITGSTPFDREVLKRVGFDEMRRIVREDEPARPSSRVSTLQDKLSSTVCEQRQTNLKQLSRTLKGELDWITLKSLEKDRIRRYQSASALAADVERFLNDEPVLACPPSTQYRLSKFVSRHRARILSAGLIGCALLILTVFYLQGERGKKDRESQVIQSIESALASANAALAARNVSLAEKYLSQAHASVNLADMDRDEFSSRVEAVQGEVEQFHAEEVQYSRFISLARQSLDELSYSGEFMAQIKEDTHAALNFFGVLDHDDWITKLQEGRLTEPQKIQVRETAFELLILLADSMIRWGEFRSDSTARDGQRYLDKALSFHEPTKVVHWIRKELHTYLNEDDEAAAANALYESTPAKNDWDWYLPGHSAGWRGNRTAARDAYHSVLKQNPSHFNSLFFLGDRYATDSMYSEAIAYYTAAIALRPDHVYARKHRARALEKTGDFGSAEADYLAALKCAAPPSWQIDAYRSLNEFYLTHGESDKAASVGKELIAKGPSLIEVQVARNGSESLATLRTMSNLGAVLWSNNEFETAAVWLTRAAEGLRRIQGSEHSETIASTHNLGACLVDGGRFGDGIPLLEGAFNLRRLHSEVYDDETLGTMAWLGRGYTLIGRIDEAIRVLEDAYAHIGSAKDKTAMDILAFLSGAHASQKNWGKSALLHRQCVERCKASLGAEHFRTLREISNLGFLLIRQGNHPAAIEVLAEALEARPRPQKLPEKFASDIVINLAIAYSRAGQTDNARRVFRDEQEIIQQAISGAELAGWQAYAVDQLLGAEAYDIAEPMALECLRARAELLPGTWQFYNAQSQMGGVRLGQAKLDEAEQLLLDAIDGLESQRATIPIDGLRHISKTLRRLVTLYKAKKDLEELAPWEERLQHEAAAVASPN